MQMGEIRWTEGPDKRDEFLHAHIIDVMNMMEVMRAQGGALEKRMDMMQMMMSHMIQSRVAAEETQQIRKRRHELWRMK